LIVSLLYLLFRRVLAVAALRLRSREFKELEIVVLRHELAVLRRQVARPRLDESDRVFLAAASRLLSGASRPSFFVRPETLLGWHRHLVRRRWTYAGRRPGRPSVSTETRELVLRLARENPRWGYQRIVGELAGVGVRVSATSVAKILREAGLPPADARTRLSWREFLHAHAASIIACDFFTVETLLARTSLRTLLHRDRHAPRAPRRLQRQPGWTLDNPAGAAACGITIGAPDADPVSHPRPRQ
jgi:putative transposase